MTSGFDVDLQYEQTTPDGRTRLTIDVVDGGLAPTEVIRLRFSLCNESDEVARPAISTGVPPPFGLLKLRGDPGEFFLWTDAYPSHRHVETDGRRVTAWVDKGISIVLEPEDCVEHVYSIRTDEYELQEMGGLRPGEYGVVDQNGNRIEIEGTERQIRLLIS